MLAELHVRDLGVIADLTLVLEPGMTALTGETGAGKTLLVEAIELLVGGRADPVLVRPGADEARVEGRFVAGDEEIVLARAVPRNGRSRAYVDGRLATVAELAEIGGRLVDLHGQHAHQSLLAGRVQRAALDRFGGVDLGAPGRGPGPGRGRRRGPGRPGRRRPGPGPGDRPAALPGGRARRAPASPTPTRTTPWRRRRTLLAAAAAHRQAGAAAHAALRDDGGAADAVALAIEAVAGRRAVRRRSSPGCGRWRPSWTRPRPTPARRPTPSPRTPSASTRSGARRRLLRELCRKYGERLSDVLAYGADARSRLAELHSHDERVTELEEERIVAVAAVEEAAAAVGRARREAAPRLAAAVEAPPEGAGPGPGPLRGGRRRRRPGRRRRRPSSWAPTRARPALPLAKVASGGELARTMLACRLVLSEAPPTLVFDEVDAGVGGQAALAVGRALAALAGPGDR